ncbi:MAG: amidohydrolase [Pseudomonadota bacterium]
MITADIVLENGPVWCGLAEGEQDAVALWQGLVLATGTREAVGALKGPATRVIDLGGRFAMPGLYDAHMHLLPLGLAMDCVDARYEAAPSIAALVEAIRARAATQAPGTWVLARGYDQGRWQEGRHPSVDDLDRAAPEHPVYLVRACGHVGVVNSAAMRLAGLTPETPTPPGGLIERGPDGRLTGLLAENGRDAVHAVLPAATHENLVAAIEGAGRACLRLGITSVMDAAVGTQGGRAELAAYRTAERSARLPVRTLQCLMGGSRGIAAEAVAEGLVTGTGSDLLRVGPVKIFTDGSAGGKTAAMSEPYLGVPETHGVLCLTDEECHAEIAHYHAAGCQMAIHAIGDVAIEQVLSGYEKALAAQPDPTRRHRIEHCGFLSEGQLARMRSHAILPAPQPSFLREFGDLYLQVVGEVRTAPSYPMRAWIEAGLHPSASTDAPVTDLDPLANLHAMVTRATRSGRVIGADQVLSREEALHAYTWAAAYGGREEHRKGRLVPGQLADVAVFSHDLRHVEAAALLGEVACEMTILGGEIVYERGG